ncbi:MAG: orotate phosphoribosyltransferase [Bacteroidota bacterium]
MSASQVTKIAESLLKIKAVRLQPQTPFTWASGWRSPVYCDNRLALSFPPVRTLVRDCLTDSVRDEFPQAGGIAGVATAGIPQGVLVADQLALPFIYIRAKPKGHGLTNQIEGQIDPEAEYIVVEDLISTGGSSLKAVRALQAAGGKVRAVISVFTYGFPHANQAFAEANIPLISLLDLNGLLEKAVEIQYIRPEEMAVIDQWRQDPQKWSQAFLASQSS